MPWFQYTDAVVESPGESRDEVRLLAELAGACAAPLYGSRLVQSLFTAGGWLKRLPLAGRYLPTAAVFLLGLVCRMAGLGSLQQLRRELHGRVLQRPTAGNYLGQRVVTTTGRVQLAPPDLMDLLQTRIPAHFAGDVRSLADDEFRLVTKRERFSHNSWAHNHPDFIQGRRITNYLYLNPADAARLALREGDTVRVSSVAGTVEVPVSLTEDMMPGAVALPHGWGHQASEGQRVAGTTRGVNANRLAADGPDAIEPISGMAHFNGIRVRLAKA